MKKALIILLVLLVVFLLFPVKYTQRSFKKQCDAYCKSTSSDMFRALNCDLPMDGIVTGCLGVSIKTGSDGDWGKCFSWDRRVCLGFVLRTGEESNPLVAKSKYILSLFKL